MKDYNINDKEWDDELEGAPNLHKAAEEKEFEVPEGYFDSLSTSIMSKIETDELYSGKEAVVLPLITIKKWLIPSLAVAAIVLAFFIFGKINKQENKREVAIDAADIYNSELLENLDESQLVDALAALTVDTSSTKTGELERYLLESSTDDALINDLWFKLTIIKHWQTNIIF